MSDDNFRVGKQPCGSFTYRTVLPMMPDPPCRKDGCIARVRYCECCSALHHSGGLQTCPVKEA